MRRLLRPLVLVVVLATTAACMGQFALTKGLYNWNDKVTDSKVINNVVFWGLGILPVYSLAMAGDLFIFNVIEFWTGKNLFADDAVPGATRVVKNDDGSVTLERAGVSYVAKPIGARRASVSRDGELVGTLEALEDGSLVIQDADGNDVAVVTPEEAQAMAPTVAQLAR